MHTERWLDELFSPPTSHKAMTIKTLMRWAQIVCDTPNSLCGKNKYLNHVFHKNNYNAVFIKWNTYRPTKADGRNRNPTPITTVNIPYIKGTSETISRTLQPYNIHVAHKLRATLQHLLTNVKDSDEPNNRQGGYDFMIDHRSHTHNPSCCEIKPEKNSERDNFKTFFNFTSA